MKQLVRTATNTSNIGVAPTYTDIKADQNETFIVEFNWEGQIEISEFYNFEWVDDIFDNAQWSTGDDELDDIVINEDVFLANAQKAIEPNTPLMKGIYDISLTGTFEAVDSDGVIDVDADTFKLTNILVEPSEN